jgi:hypothetical protein
MGWKSIFIRYIYMYSIYDNESFVEDLDLSDLSIFQ